MTDEYNLSEAGPFTEIELLDFQRSELEKGKHVDKVWITKYQANYLANDIHKAKPKLTGSRLVDYWNVPNQEVKLSSVHGIEIGIED